MTVAIDVTHRYRVVIGGAVHVDATRTVIRRISG
jgi:hypothetical protein